MKKDLPNQIKETKYFEHRGVDSEYMANYQIPVYLKKVLPSNKNAKILDIGCGFGFVLQGLKNIGYTDIHGIDISDEAISFCVKNGLSVEKINNINDFINTNTKKYDIVIMTHVIEHIEKDHIILLLNNINNKLLSDRGGLYLTTPNAQARTGCYWRYEDFTHTTIFTGGSLIYVLKSAGFKNISFIDPNDLERHSMIIKQLKYLLLSIYRYYTKMWNRVTATSYHSPSPEIYAFELKILAKKYD